MKSLFPTFLLCLMTTPIFAAELPCMTLRHSDSGFLIAALRNETAVQLDGIASVSIDRRAANEATVRIALQNGKSLRLQVRQQCSTGILESVVVQSYVCKKTVDCMPSNDSEQQRYCSDEYVKWAQKNCESKPEVLY